MYLRKGCMKGRGMPETLNRNLLPPSFIFLVIASLEGRGLSFSSRVQMYLPQAWHKSPSFLVAMCQVLPFPLQAGQSLPPPLYLHFSLPDTSKHILKYDIWKKTKNKTSLFYHNTIFFQPHCFIGYFFGYLHSFLAHLLVLCFLWVIQSSNFEFLGHYFYLGHCCSNFLHDTSYGNSR